jgi:hypothetical protein
VVNPEMTPEELLQLAMGATEQAKTLTADEDLRKHYLTPGTQKEYLVKRRVFRRTMFSVRWKLHFKQDNFTPEEKIVKEIIDARIKPDIGLTWETFTYQWDVSPNPEKPFEVIQKHQWFKEGGGLDQDIGTFYPAAFTEQGIA